MCGRVVVGLDSDSLAEIAQVNISEMRNLHKFRQSYNLAPGSYLPTFFSHQSSSMKSYNYSNQDQELIEKPHNKEKYILEAGKWRTKNNDNYSVVNAR